MALFILGILAAIGITILIISWMVDDGSFGVVLMLLGVVFGITSCVNYTATCWWGGEACRKSLQENKASEEREQARCGEARVVSTAADGVQLWVTNEGRRCQANDGRPIYFSSTGAQTSHTERYGKVTHTYDDIVPAGLVR